MLRRLLDALQGMRSPSTHKLIRVLEMLGILHIYTKAGYYLSLIDQVTPLIDIIKRIFLYLSYRFLYRLFV